MFFYAFLKLIRTMRSFETIEPKAVAAGCSNNCCMTGDWWSIGFAFETNVVNSPVVLAVLVGLVAVVDAEIQWNNCQRLDSQLDGNCE